MNLALKLSFFLFLCSSAQAQNFSLSVGTDIPYQFYLGATLETNNFDVSYRSGLLTQPYSDIIVRTFEEVDEIYIDILEKSYDVGWMNSIGAYYKFTKRKRWYIGLDFRLDYLTAADSPAELIEIATGESLGVDNEFNIPINTSLGVKMYGIGFRFGKSFQLKEKHVIKTELSLSKYISVKSSLSIGGNEIEGISEQLNNLLWEKVFKKNGYLGGVGISYSYRF